MDMLHFIHLFFVGCWLGTVCVEGVVEWRAAKDDKLSIIGSWHYYIDIFVEIPTFTIVLITGTILTARLPEISGLSLLKITLGLIPVIVNIWCVWPVMMRKKYLGAGKNTEQNKKKIEHYSRQIYLAFAIGSPFGVAALIIGLMYFM